MQQMEYQVAVVPENSVVQSCRPLSCMGENLHRLVARAQRMECSAQTLQHSPLQVRSWPQSQKMKALPLKNEALVQARTQFLNLA